MRTRLRATALKSDYIREAMDQSRSKRQVVILDCCNSGAFPQGTKAALGGPMGLASAFQGYGRFVLMASDATQFAWEGDKIIGETQNSLFTHYLVKGLEGEADRDADGIISVDELYDYAFDQICQITAKQTPTKAASKVEGDIVLRRIRHLEDIKPIPLPPDLLEEAEDTRPYVRQVAVQKLEKILQGKNLGLARSAMAALEKIAADENSTRRVAQDAMQALEAYRQKHEVSTQLDLPRPKRTDAASPIEPPAQSEPKAAPPVAAASAPSHEPPPIAAAETPLAGFDETIMMRRPIAAAPLVPAQMPGQAPTSLPFPVPAAAESPAVSLPQASKAKPWKWIGAIVGAIFIGCFGCTLAAPLLSASGLIPPFFPTRAVIAPSADLTGTSFLTAALPVAYTDDSLGVPSRTATPYATRTSTPRPTVTFTPFPTSTITPPPIPGSAPTILSVRLTYDRSSGKLVIYQNFQFIDPDGDTNYIQYEVLSVTPGITVNVVNGPVKASPQAQMAGTVIYGTWNCGTSVYNVGLRATLSDAAGHMSNSVNYLMNCK